MQPGAQLEGFLSAHHWILHWQGGSRPVHSPGNPMPAATGSMAWFRGLGALSRVRWWLAPCVPCRQCTRCTSRNPHVCSYCFCIHRAAETSWVLSPGFGGYRLQARGAVTWVCFLGVGFLPVGQQWSGYTLAGMSECGQRWEAF